MERPADPQQAPEEGSNIEMSTAWDQEIVVSPVCASRSGGSARCHAPARGDAAAACRLWTGVTVNKAGTQKLLILTRAQRPA